MATKEMDPKEAEIQRLKRDLELLERHIQNHRMVDPRITNCLEEVSLVSEFSRNINRDSVTPRQSLNLGLADEERKAYEEKIQELVKKFEESQKLLEDEKIQGNKKNKIIHALNKMLNAAEKNLSDENSAIAKELNDISSFANITKDSSVDPTYTINGKNTTTNQADYSMSVQEVEDYQYLFNNVKKASTAMFEQLKHTAEFLQKLMDSLESSGDSNAKKLLEQIRALQFGLNTSMQDASIMFDDVHKAEQSLSMALEKSIRYSSFAQNTDFVNEELKTKTDELREKCEELRRKSEEIKEKSEELKHLSEDLRHKDEELNEKNEELQYKDEIIKEKDEILNEKDEFLKETEDQLRQKIDELEAKDAELRNKIEELKEKDFLLIEKIEHLKSKDDEIQEKSKELEIKNTQLQEELEMSRKELEEKRDELRMKIEELKDKCRELEEKDTLLREKIQELDEKNQKLGDIENEAPVKKAIPSIVEEMTKIHNVLDDAAKVFNSLPKAKKRTTTKEKK